jgi:hypothetical protein
VLTFPWGRGLPVSSGMELCHTTEPAFGLHYQAAKR